MRANSPLLVPVLVRDPSSGASRGSGRFSRRSSWGAAASTPAFAGLSGTVILGSEFELAVVGFPEDRAGSGDLGDLCGRLGEREGGLCLEAYGDRDPRGDLE